jgi:hypothetical protein
MPTEHVTVRIDRPATEVYAYASDLGRLPNWAAGLTDASLRFVDGRWVTESPMGQVTIEFAPDNPYGVLDHDVTLPTGETVYNPMRVIADGDGCEVVFTVRQRQDMSDEAFRSDVAAVRADLETLRDLLERG